MSLKAGFAQMAPIFPTDRGGQVKAAASRSADVGKGVAHNQTVVASQRQDSTLALVYRGVSGRR
jgi:hypothetical protein